MGAKDNFEFERQLILRRSESIVDWLGSKKGEGFIFEIFGGVFIQVGDLRSNADEGSNDRPNANYAGELAISKMGE